MKQICVVLIILGKKIIWHPIYKVSKQIVFLRIGDIDGGGADKFRLQIAI